MKSLLLEDCERMLSKHLGGLLVVDVESKEEAIELLNNDPAKKAELRNIVRTVIWNLAILDNQVQS